MYSGCVVERQELTRFKEIRSRLADEAVSSQSATRAAREWLARKEGAAEQEGAASPDSITVRDLDEAERRAAGRRQHRLSQRRAVEARAAIESAHQAAERVARLERMLAEARVDEESARKAADDARVEADSLPLALSEEELVRSASSSALARARGDLRV